MTALPRIFIEPSRSLQQEFMPRRGLEVRLATSMAEIDAAQALRYRVFYEEMGAHPTPRAASERRDRDSFDNHCDHLLIIDHERGDGGDAVIATYRLLRRSQAAKHGGFYSATEFDISPLLAHRRAALDLLRSSHDPASPSGAPTHLT